jgi:sec-independent protein translocase protein TatB
MFDLDPGKMLVFCIVALAVIPPKDLPRVLRTVGKYIGQIRRMGADFQGQFTQALKEADLDSVRKEIDDINKTAKAHTAFDPAELMRDKSPKSAEPSPYETIKVEPPQETFAQAPVPPPTPEDVNHETPAPDALAHNVPAPDVPAHEPEKIAVGPR